MRSRRLALLALTCLTIAATLLLIRSAHPRSSVPLGKILVLSYTNVTIPTGSNYPFPGEWIRGQLLLTNNSTLNLVYASWGTEPYGWVKAQTMTGWTNGRLAPPFTGLFTLVPPRGSVTFPAWLPAETIRWRCGFAVRGASIRERTAWRLAGTGWERHLGRVLGWGIQLLPSKPGPAQELSSEELEIDVKPHNKAAGGNVGERRSSARSNRSLWAALPGMPQLSRSANRRNGTHHD